jgi:hypothetical protein
MRARLPRRSSRRPVRARAKGRQLSRQRGPRRAGRSALGRPMPGRPSPVAPQSLKPPTTPATRRECRELRVPRPPDGVGYKRIEGVSFHETYAQIPSIFLAFPRAKLLKIAVQQYLRRERHASEIHSIMETVTVLSAFPGRIVSPERLEELGLVAAPAPVKAAYAAPFEFRATGTGRITGAVSPARPSTMRRPAQTSAGRTFSWSMMAARLGHRAGSVAHHGT